MKRFCLLSASLALLLASAVSSQAWFKMGYVYCDANTNNLIDPGDVGVQSVLVVTTNISGTFSNASWTTAEGFFIMDLPPTPDFYVDFILPATLPANSTVVFPAAGFAQFSITAGGPDSVTNNFLIHNPACVTPPPPPPATNNCCWLTGGGTIKAGKGQPLYTFAGVVYPGCKADAAGGGSWLVIDHANKLQFKAVSIEVVNCGNVAGRPPGSKSPPTPYNYIDFQGVGMLEGIAGNMNSYGLVTFYAHAEDLGEPGKSDRLWFSAWTDAGVAVQIGTGAGVENMGPVVISTGNLQLHSQGCDCAPEKKQKTKKK